MYEDFLPRSAAGIFQSNLADSGTRNSDLSGDSRDLAWMSGMLEREVADPMDLYAAERARSLQALCDRFGTDPNRLTRTTGTTGSAEHPNRHSSTTVKESI